MSKYAWVLFWSGIFPLILSFYPPLRFYRNWKGLIVSIATVVLFFGAWDVAVTARGHWRFEPSGVGDVKFFGLPLEEWLFFVVIPFCCLFTWEAMLYISQKLEGKGQK